MAFQMRWPALSKIAAVLCVLLLLWLGYDSLRWDGLHQSSGSLDWTEGERCLFKQGLEETGYLASTATYSQFLCGQEQYPSGLCTVRLLYLDHELRKFVARAREEYTGQLNEELQALLWPVTTSSAGWRRCARYYDEAFIFTVDNSPSDEQYFRLHMHTFIPLYSLLALRKHLGPPAHLGYSVVLMPAVEHYSLQTVDWSTEALSNHHKFGALQQMTEAFAGSMEVMPLVASSLLKETQTCIQVAHFGVAGVNSSDGELLRGFSHFMQNRLGLPLPFPQLREPFICLAKRSANRRILNEQGLVSAVSKIVKIQVVQFDALSYREQVAQMQQFTILAGFHGAELLNAIYMPQGSVSIQLVPFEAKSLNTEKYAQILRAHGPYLEWHNTHEQYSRPNQVDDSDNSLADTVVYIDEFVELIKQALRLGINTRLVHYQGP